MVVAAKSMVLGTFRFREVLFNFVSQDLKVKYKRTWLGYVWSLLNPLLQLAVLSTVFSHFAGRGIRDYALYLLSGILAWNFFQSATQMSAHCFIENENFMKKVRLPKLIFPLARNLLRAVDFLFALGALTVIAIVAGFPFHSTALLLPVAILNLFLWTLGCSLVFAVITVFFRDTEYLLGVFLQLLYFATPLLYPITSLPERVRNILELNPLFWQIRIFQQILYAGVVPSASEWGLALGSSCLSLGVGFWLLLRYEDELIFRL